MRRKQAWLEAGTLWPRQAERRGLAAAGRSVRGSEGVEASRQLSNGGVCPFLKFKRRVQAGQGA